MKLNLAPGMRLKNKAGCDVEILKTNFNQGEGEVTAVLVVVTYSDGVQGVYTVTLEGKSFQSPNLSLSNPYDDLKDGDPVFVRDDDEKRWGRRHFCRFQDEFIVCYPDGKTKWGFNPSYEAVTHWKEVRIPTEEELKAGKVID